MIERRVLFRISTGLRHIRFEVRIHVYIHVGLKYPLVVAFVLLTDSWHGDKFVPEQSQLSLRDSLEFQTPFSRLIETIILSSFCKNSKNRHFTVSSSEQMFDVGPQLEDGRFGINQQELDSLSVWSNATRKSVRPILQRRAGSSRDVPLQPCNETGYYTFHNVYRRTIRIFDKRIA
jgi:hypothetical protein